MFYGIYSLGEEIYTMQIITQINLYYKYLWLSAKNEEKIVLKDRRRRSMFRVKNQGKIGLIFK